MKEKGKTIKNISRNKGTNKRITTSTNISKKNNKTKISLLTIVSLCIGIYFISVLYTQQISIDKYNSKLEMYNSQISKNNEIIKGLNADVDDIEKDTYIENIARKELGLVKPYEKIFIDVNK